MKTQQFGLCIVAIFFALACRAQISIEQCYDWATNNYPLIKQYDLIEQSRDYTLSNASKGWLPQVNASVSGYAFTDVIDGSNAIGQAMEMKNLMVSASVTVNQTLYDGGAIAAKKQLATAESEMERYSLNSSMYEIHQRVNQLYFSILLIDEQLRMNHLLQDDLRLSQKTVQSMQKHGIANQNDVDAISVELLGSAQREIGLLGQRNAYLQMLSAFVGKELNENETLEIPTKNTLSNGKRPELDYFDSQERALDARKSLLDSQLKPRVSAFALGMVHTKMTDIMNNGMLAGGVTLSWNIGALYTRKSDLAKIELDRQKINVNRETFLFNNAQQSRLSNGQIASLQQQITKDDEIVRLRENIRSREEKRLKNGLASVNDVLRSINAVSEARQTRSTHEVQLLQELYNLKYINNLSE